MAQIMSGPKNDHANSPKGHALACLIAMLSCSTGNALARDLYVSPGGNDSVTYDANSISQPWKSVDLAIYSLKAGDTLYLRGGTYPLLYPMWLRSDYTSKTNGGNPSITNVAQSGTATQQVTVRGYPGEKAVIDAGSVGAILAAALTIDDKNYWNFQDFSVVNSNSAFIVALNGSADHITFRNLTVQMSTGGDNAGAFVIHGEGATNIVIDGNSVIGPGNAVHQNTAGIWLNRSTSLKVLRNKISNVPVGIYYKHGLVPGFNPATVDVEIAYNYIENTGRDGARFSVSYANIHDNVFAANTTLIEIGPSAVIPNGDYNRFTHNTVLSPLGLSAEDTNSPPGSYQNTIRDNLLLGTYGFHRWASPTIAHDTRTDYNGFPANSPIYEYSETFTPQTWAMKSGQDTHSISGNFTFEGGSNPSSISGYRLSIQSAGLGAASDGKNLGADIDAIMRGGSVPAPSAPTNLSIN